MATSIVDSAYRVHKQLGPGLLESAYQVCLAYEPRRRGHVVETEVALAVSYDGVVLDAGGRIDTAVDGPVLIENKVVQSLVPVHFAQLLTYLRMSGIQLGFLINWNSVLIMDGIRRMVNGLDEGPGLGDETSLSQRR